MGWDYPSHAAPLKIREPGNNQPPLRATSRFRLLIISPLSDSTPLGRPSRVRRADHVANRAGAPDLHLHHAQSRSGAAAASRLIAQRAGWRQPGMQPHTRVQYGPDTEASTTQSPCQAQTPPLEQPARGSWPPRSHALFPKMVLATGPCSATPDDWGRSGCRGRSTIRTYSLTCIGISSVRRQIAVSAEEGWAKVRSTAACLQEITSSVTWSALAGRRFGLGN